MRERLNNDPKFQIAFFGIAVVALGLILMIQMGGGGAAETTDDPATTTPAPATGTDSATGTDPAAGGAATTDPATGSATPPPTDTATPPATGTTPPPAAGATDALLPTKGLPEDVLVAYAKKQPVVLLVVDPGAKGTPRLEKYANRLEGYRDAAVFVVPTKKIAKYSRITEGVAVTQTPAIIVVTPRNVASAAPSASVSYGIRSEKSFRQAIDDSIYEGGPRPAYP